MGLERTGLEQVPFSPLDPWIRTRNGTERPRRSARQPRDRSLSFILSSCSSLFSLDFQVQDTLMDESRSLPPSLPPVVLYFPFFHLFLSSRTTSTHTKTPPRGSRTLLFYLSIYTLTSFYSSPAPPR